MKTLTLWMMLGVCAWAGVERPVLGYVMDARGGLHAVEGIAGAFVVGGAVEDATAYAPEVALTLEHRESGFYVVDGDGRVADILPPEAACALLLTHGAVYATADEVVIGAVRIALAGTQRLRAISADLVQASTDDGEYLLRVESGREALFRLPAIPVEVAE